MRKHVLPLLLCVVLLLCCTTAYAAETRAAEGRATLSFSNSTANCTYTFTSPGKVISVQMELWRGSVLVDSWSKTATHTVSLNESCTVTPGLTYTLKVSGTYGGVSITPSSITKTCPRT